MGSDTDKLLCLIDTSALVYRAFHAIRPLSTSSGLPTNALFGFCQMLLKVLDDYRPSHAAAALDLPEKTWRHEVFPAYKAQRPPLPPELEAQFPYVAKLLKAFNLPAVGVPGYEADDIIATLTRKARAEGMRVMIVSGDKDLMSLVGDGVVMVDTMKDRCYDLEAVREKHGVCGERLLDLLALAGDSSDNIPGVPGIGPKSALKLLDEFGDLGTMLAETDRIERKSWREKLQKFQDEARLSRRLVTLSDTVETGLSLADLKRREPDLEALREIFAELEFHGLSRRLSPQQTVTREGYRLVESEDALKTLLTELEGVTELAVDTETTGLDAMRAGLVGISLAWNAEDAAYIPIGHAPEFQSLNPEAAKTALKPLLADPAIRKWGQNIKYDAIILARAGLVLGGIDFDTMVASYLLNPTRHRHGLDALSMEHLGHTPIAYKEVAGSGRSQVTMDQLAPEKVSDYACEDAQLVFQLVEKLTPKLVEDDLEELFRNIEMPLLEVLMRMEMTGVYLDVELLQKTAADYEIRLERIAAEIYELAGEEFNINSPKQLAVILFDRLGLPVVKKTKTGPSTALEVLEKLADSHPLPAKILEYRSLAKLVSTYLEALPKLVHPETGRVHTSYNQAVTATGRLSSSDPNLQNIPIRGEDGALIRRAFIGEGDNLIVAADYSQIELRILAHFSGDPALVEAFNKGEDIHARTAAGIFNVLPMMVTPEMRRQAKTINFGLIYGMGANKLARELKIDRKTAKAYIEGYFSVYSGVREFFDRVVAEAEAKGYVTTLCKRRRYLPEINSKSRNLQEMARRTAINTPIQGTAADLIKLAMVVIDRRLREDGWRSRMIMQVHDELVFEAPPAEIDELTMMVRKEMAEVVKLRVPLVVDIGVGENWLEAH
ncbi:MAG: DNA polymerase I [Deltaproteobacteria bacterium]|nr:DNA polymerase I [Deltaproteobacteria bacterium]